jgi:hypothetical protein
LNLALGDLYDSIQCSDGIEILLLLQ